MMLLKMIILSLIYWASLDLDPLEDNISLLSDKYSLTCVNVNPPSDESHRRKFHERQHHMKILSSLYSVHTIDTILMLWNSKGIYRKNPFALGDAYLTTFC